MCRNNLYKLMAAVLFCSTFASCGELFELDVEEYSGPDSMRIDRKEFYIMLGDTCDLSPVFTPDTVSLPSIFWLSFDKNIVSVENGQVVAKSVGSTQIMAMSVDNMLSDTCVVNVIERWSLSPFMYPYDMVIYANVTDNGEPANEDYRLAAYVDDELRGVGEVMTQHDITYTRLRIYSPTFEEEEIKLVAYAVKEARFYTLPVTMVFDGETHGTITDLHRLEVRE